MARSVWWPALVVSMSVGSLAVAGEPALKRLMSDDAAVRKQAVADLARAGTAKAAAESLSETLKGREPAERLAAARGLEALGPNAAPAIGALTERLRFPDADLRRACVRALGAIGPAAFKEANLHLARIMLKPTLGKTTENQLAYAALKRMGGKPRTHLLRALKSPDPRKRALGATLLGIGQERDAVGALSNVLKDKDWFCRWKAAEALGRLGKDADRAAPGLARLLRDPKAPVQRAAATSLGAIGNPRVVPDLAKAVNATDDFLSRDASRALEQFGRQAAPAVEALTQALGRKRIAANAAADALGRLGPAGKTAALALGKALSSSEKGLRERAARALGRLGPHAAAAVPALVAALEKGTWAPLRKKSEWGGVFATWALGRIGAPAKPAIPILTTLSQSKDRRIQKAAKAALKRVRKAVKAAEPEEEQRKPAPPRKTKKTTKR